MKWKPTSEERKAIRAYAKSAANHRGVVLEPATRFSLTGRGVNLNVRLISDEEDWGDTDLNSHMNWSDFCYHGIDLTPEGRGIVDVYVYSLGRDGELETNIQIVIENGRLAQLDQTSGPSQTFS